MKFPENLELIRYPHPVLRKKSASITEFDDDLKDFAKRMIETMYNCKGVGLAAIQVAVPVRLLVTDHAQTEDGPGEPRVWINPRIENSQGCSVYQEGCLSVPDIYANVERHDIFDFVYQDVDGHEQREHFNVGAGDFLGTVVQHELDHLEGKLFVDHLSPVQLNLFKRKLRDLEKNYKKANGKTGAVLRR